MSDRTVILVDGENLVLRFQAMIDAGYKQKPDVVYQKDDFVWHPRITHVYNFEAVRASYYVTKVGDDVAIHNLKTAISKIPYQYSQTTGWGSGRLNPRVYKKQEKTKKTKSVDINITVDALRHTYSNSADIIYLLTGDGDYLPLVEEIMRQGKQAWVGAFSSGLHPDLMHVPDDFIDLDKFFFSDVSKPTVVQSDK